MKNLIRILCAMFIIAMLTMCLYVPASAATVDWTQVKLEPLVEIINGYIETSDELLVAGQYSMRGFAVSPDGRFAFGGFLNPNSFAAMNIFDLESALAVDAWQHMQDANGGYSYPKGLAVDDRNNVYIGAAYYPNYGTADFAIASYDSNGALTEQGMWNIVTEGTIGDKDNAPKMGVNGVDVAKIGDKYYMYAVINYDMDRLYRFDVTDVKNPKLDTAFGTDGYVDLATVYGMKDANYLDVESDGTIYLCGSSSGEGDGMFILSADGKTLLNFAACRKAYSVAVWEDYILITSQSGPTCITVLDKITLAPVATIAAHDGANSYVYVTVVNDVMYVADQGSNTGSYERIVVAPLSDAGKAVIDARKAAYAAALESTTVEDTTPAPIETTPAPVDTTTAEPQDTTTTPADTTTPAPSTPDTTTAASNEKSGCGSVVALGLVACIMPVAVIIAKKKRD